MTAFEAKQLTNSVNLKKDILPQIYRAVTENAMSGLSYLYIGNPMPELIEKLSEDGFRIGREYEIGTGRLRGITIYW